MASTFSPAEHLCYQKPESVITMKELGLEGVGISPIGVSAPFPLFTREGVTELRREVLSEKVLKDFTVSSYISPYQGREFSKIATPFLHAAWSSDEVTRAVSEAAGIELVPIMDLELGHTNYQLGPKGKAGVRDLPIVPGAPKDPLPADELVKYQKLADEDMGDNEDNVVIWHHDSYPFVCVLMLSDVSTMIGGETALMGGDGVIRKARGPGLGYAVVLQGRHIKHVALRSYNAGERITMVTSYRAKDPSVRDASVLDTIHPITKRNRINYQWTSYRLKLMSARLAAKAQAIEDKKQQNGAEDDLDGSGGKEVVNVDEMRQWLQDQIEYLAMTGSQLMDGSIPDASEYRS